MIDVFICTYNPKPEYLKRTVEAIFLQELNKNEWGLTVIDNNSTKPVAELDFIKQLKINVIVEKKQGLTAARKCAQNNSKAEILVFVDDDNILAPDYLSEVKAAFKDTGIGILSGEITPEYEKVPKQQFLKFDGMLAIRRFDLLPAGVTKVQGVKYNNYFPIGAGMAIRQSVISGYYNELTSENYIDGRKGDGLMSSEDTDLDYYAISKGFNIGVCTKMKLKHIIPEGRTTKKYLTKLAVGNVRSIILVNAKWSPIFKETLFRNLEFNLLDILIRYTVFWLLSFKDSYSIKFEIFKELLSIRKKQKLTV